MNPLAIVLAISLAANALLGYAYLGKRDTAVVATERTEQATGAAQACSKGVDSLQKQASKRHADSAPRIEQAKQDADAGNQQADTILSTPAAVPGDDCRSAQARVATWWNERGQK
jgi:hypothetical protein